MIWNSANSIINILLLFGLLSCKNIVDDHKGSGNVGVEAVLHTRLLQNGVREFIIQTPETPAHPFRVFKEGNNITGIEIVEKTYKCLDGYYQHKYNAMWFVALRDGYFIKNHFFYGQYFDPKNAEVIKKAKPLQKNHWYRLSIITSASSVDPMYFQHTDKEYTVSSYNDPRVKEIEKMRKACEDVPENEKD